MAKILSKLDFVLSIEFLDQKNVFGLKASMEEMSKFKSKIKKQVPEYDNDLEMKKQAEEEKQQREEKELMMQKV